MKKKLLTLILTPALCLSLSACGEEPVSTGEAPTMSPSPPEEFSPPEKNTLPSSPSDSTASDSDAVAGTPADGSWAIYWYLCGSDLESNGGFDTCLMATVDVAAVFQNFSRYLVASEEVEPGNGWYYSGWLGELAANPAMDGDDLGIAICNTYYEGCEAEGTQDQTTLSLTDLTRLSPLLEAYEAFGQEALTAASQDPGFFAELGRAASLSENYGGNTREQGYTNLVDLGHLARQTAWMLPSAQNVSDALEQCVVYRIGGIYRAEATGLSCYYPYSGDLDHLNGYIHMGEGQAFKHLYSYGLTGEPGADGDAYLALLSIQELPKVLTLADMGWDGAPLDLNEEGTSILTLGPEADTVLSGIGFSLYYVDESNDQMLLLGTDNDIIADWENGVFCDNFRGVWGAVDGHLVYMELYFEGDVITTIWKIASYSGDDDFEMYTAEELTVTADTAFGEAPLFDGSYSMVFEMRDAAGHYACSDAVTFDCAAGEITTTVYGDWSKSADIVPLWEHPPDCGSAIGPADTLYSARKKGLPYVAALFSSDLCLRP